MAARKRGARKNASRRSSAATRARSEGLAVRDGVSETQGADVGAGVSETQGAEVGTGVSQTLDDSSEER